ncbi:MAG: hypothetical protein ACE5HN_04755, partial [Nitrospiria bacterium]
MRRHSDLGRRRVEGEMEGVRCGRCGGFMTYECFADRSEAGEYWSFEGWHCIYCGDVIDRLI